MSAVDAFPAAAQEEQISSQEIPDFYSQAQRLESIALDGLDTPTGKESYQFRTGIEIEFALLDPMKWREAIAESEKGANERHNKFLETVSNPATKEKIIRDHEENMARSRHFQFSAIRNPEAIGGSIVDSTELLDEFKQYAAGFIRRLPAKNEAEEQKKAKWLEEVPNFGVGEVINFLIYEEFSNPTLADTTPQANATLEELDAFSESHGWLEFRFGIGTLQTGYYDNEGMSEVRMAPCSPSEAIRRKQIISDRIADIASQFGVLVQSTSNHEHINLSAYQKNAQGTFIPVIGQSKAKREKTLDITAGIAKVFQAGVWLHPEDMQWDYKFQPNYEGNKLTFSPGRKDVRLLEDRLELRTRFHQAEQAVNWLVAGAVQGLSETHSAISSEGVQVPEISNMYSVQRSEGFNKHTDLQIQRALENSEPKEEDGVETFELNSGYNMIRGEAITETLLGAGSVEKGCDYFNAAIFASTVVSQDGTPAFDVNIFRARYEQYDEKTRAYLDQFMGDSAEDLARRLNQRFKVVRLVPSQVISGTVRYKAESIKAALEALSHSPEAKLTYGNNLDTLTSWLKAGIPKK